MGLSKTFTPKPDYLRATLLTVSLPVWMLAALRDHSETAKTKISKIVQDSLTAKLSLTPPAK